MADAELQCDEIEALEALFPEKGAFVPDDPTAIELLKAHVKNSSPEYVAIPLSFSIWLLDDNKSFDSKREGSILFLYSFHVRFFYGYL
eukprot:m.186061 g.186061  ORF g.186061 m.186061 type:complete len:88 (+) comp15586_c0_seq7:72-335(+)